MGTLGKPTQSVLTPATTGLPKGIPRTHNDYVFQWERMADVGHALPLEDVVVVRPRNSCREPRRPPRQEHYTGLRWVDSNRPDSVAVLVFPGFVAHLRERDTVIRCCGLVVRDSDEVLKGIIRMLDGPCEVHEVEIRRITVVVDDVRASVGQVDDVRGLGLAVSW
jgi:hypothetical protein